MALHSEPEGREDFGAILRFAMGAPWTTYVFGPFYTLLPKRWRGDKRHGSAQLLARAALISGVGESLTSLFLLRAWYLSFLGMLGEKYARYAQTTQANSLIP